MAPRVSYTGNLRQDLFYVLEPFQDAMEFRCGVLPVAILCRTEHFRDVIKGALRSLSMCLPGMFSRLEVSTFLSSADDALVTAVRWVAQHAVERVQVQVACSPLILPFIPKSAFLEFLYACPVPTLHFSTFSYQNCLN